MIAWGEKTNGEDNVVVFTRLADRIRTHRW